MNNKETVIVNNELEALSCELNIEYHGRTPTPEALDKARKDGISLLRKAIRLLLIQQLKFMHVETVAKVDLDKHVNAMASSSLHRNMRMARTIYMKKTQPPCTQSSKDQK